MTHRWLSFFVAALLCSRAFALDNDEKLSLIQSVYQLQPKTCDTMEAPDTEIEAGKLLFESTLLSGDRDTACSTCHLEQHTFADGLPIAIGVGGKGEGSERMRDGRGVLVQRNAFTLFGRGSPEFSVFFWDGKAQLVNKTIVSQFGEYLPSEFKSTLAVAAILPLIERDEFLGNTKSLHKNEILRAVGDSLYIDRYKAISSAIRARLTEATGDVDRRLVKALRNAGIEIDSITLAEIGNMLAVFIRHKFRCRPSRFDRFLAGDKMVLNGIEKEGAVLFYGKGRCVACHSGSLFSDFDFHSIGTPQGNFGPHSRHRDIGRAGVTNELEDMYRFRTPPLIEVGKTAPYGHNGVFGTLQEAITHHFDPIGIYLKMPELASDDRFRSGKLLGTRDWILNSIDIQTDDETDALAAFLKTL